MKFAMFTGSTMGPYSFFEWLCETLGFCTG